MKKQRAYVGIAVGFTIASVAIAAAGDAISKSVSTNAVPILPPRNQTRAAAFANPSTNAIGAIVQSGGRLFMAMDEAIFTDGSWAPTHGSGVVSNLMAIARGPRKGMYIGNEGSTKVTVWWFSSVTDGAGITLDPYDKVIMSQEDVLQSAVWAVSASSSNAVTAGEW